MHAFSLQEINTYAHCTLHRVRLSGKDSCYIRVHNVSTVTLVTGNLVNKIVYVLRRPELK